MRSGKKGNLLYIKCSSMGTDPMDVLAYKRAHQAFPHQSTADQWFDESQFESYRMLGRCSIESVIPPPMYPAIEREGFLHSSFRLRRTTLLQ